jgi:ATP-dependent DNA helicase RecG
LELFSPVSIINGLGPAREKVLNDKGLFTLNDFLYYFPRKHLDRTSINSINELSKGDSGTIIASVETFGEKAIRKGKIFQVIVSDGTGILTLSWFNGGRYIKKMMKIGLRLVIFGKVEWYNGFVITHPEFEILDKGENNVFSSGMMPIYPMTKEFASIGLEQRRLRKIIQTILDSKISIPDFFSLQIIKQYQLISLNKALRLIHFSKNVDELKLAIRRLKFDEHFFLQLLVALKKHNIQTIGTEAMPDIGPYFKTISRSLDFELTKAQKKVIQEIHSDLKISRPMNRLIQGDVGCGKTIVAILVSSLAVGNNMQVAVMAPTEILARQHYLSFKNEFDKVNIPSSLLVGKMKKMERDPILKGLQKGKISIVIGTHALIQNDVKFKKLGLVIIDEQHRFGVNQRLRILEKGSNPHLMSMTATPIPRTLSITYHGDMDLSIIDELPANRIPVTTKIVDQSKMIKVYDFIRNKIKLGRQAIVVYPLVEESEKSDLAAAVQNHELLSNVQFPKINVGLIHGKMKPQEKEEIINKFNKNKIKILVSTTVVEVGLDVPNATIMIVEHAERFGLTQLHQLRGRVGRGTEKSYCILVKRNQSNVSRSRLEIMEKTNDGFLIADEDLKLRGPGEVFGIKQSGFFQYKIADVVKDVKIIREARELAFGLVKSDPTLNKKSNRHIKKIFRTKYSEYLENLKLI